RVARRARLVLALEALGDVARTHHRGLRPVDLLDVLDAGVVLVRVCDEDHVRLRQLADEAPRVDVDVLVLTAPEVRGLLVPGEPIEHGGLLRPVLASLHHRDGDARVAGGHAAGVPRRDVAAPPEPRLPQPLSGPVDLLRRGLVPAGGAVRPGPGPHELPADGVADPGGPTGAVLPVRAGGGGAGRPVEPPGPHGHGRRRARRAGPRVFLRGAGDRVADLRAAGLDRAVYLDVRTGV